VLRVDRLDCQTVQHHDAGDLMRSGRVALVAVDGTPGGVCVELDGTPLGVVLPVGDREWLAARPGWRDDRTRSRRRTAVRCLVMSHPRTILGGAAPTNDNDRDTR